VRAVVALLLVLSVAGPACAGKSDDTLHITWRDGVPNVDPYRNQLRTGLILAFEAWDALVYRDPDTLQLKPALAASWKQVDDTTIDFAVRPGVKFQNGDPVTADDVVYTVYCATHEPVAVPSNYAYLAGAEALDPMTVRIKLSGVFPAALEYLGMTLPIYPKAYRERVGAEAYAKAPIGAGPYRITWIDPAEGEKAEGGTGGGVRLDRFDGYYDGSPKGRPAIAHVAIRQAPDADAELADLLAGRADWIWDFPPDRFDDILRDPSLQAVRAETMRVAYMSLDAAGRTDAGGPLTKPLVRQALFHAIDRAGIARKIMQGGSRILDAPCFPTQFGCDQAIAVKYAYDPAAARKMLAEAGYNEGFQIDLVSYVLPSIAEAVRDDLKAVGVDARVTQLPTAEAVRRSAEGRAPLSMGSWGSYSINDVSAILPHFFEGGGDDYARDPEIETLVRAGGLTTDPDQRRKAYSDAIRRITGQADWLPMFTYVKTYGFTRQLRFTPRPDDLPRFYLSSWR
jgi:peptide/nickel transport system substrate-binding protein